MSNSEMPDTMERCSELDVSNSTVVAGKRAITALAIIIFLFYLIFTIMHYVIDLIKPGHIIAIRA
jgi:hypothetical protein